MDFYISTWSGPRPAGGAPAEFQVFPYGKVEAEGYPDLLVDEAAMDAVIRIFESRKKDLMVDYEHQSLGKVLDKDGGLVADFSSPDGTAPAAGWIKKLINRGRDGLWAVVEWTDRARELIEKKEYRYYSPAFNRDKKSGRLTELVNVALTNLPRMNGLAPLIAKGRAQPGDEPTKEGGMLERTKKILGLAQDATEADVEAAVEAMKKEHGELAAFKQGIEALPKEGPPAGGDVQTVIAKAITDALELPEGSSEEKVVSSITLLKANPDQAEYAKLAAEVEALRAKDVERDAREAVDAAMSAGKLLPAKEEWAMNFAKRDLEGFQSWAKDAPQVIPVGKLNLDKKSTAGAAFTPEEIEVGKQLGLTPEQMKAAKRPAEKKDPWGV